MEFTDMQTSQKQHEVFLPSCDFVRGFETKPEESKKTRK